MALPISGQNLLSEEGLNEGCEVKNRVFETQGEKGCS